MVNNSALCIAGPVQRIKSALREQAVLLPEMPE